MSPKLVKVIERHHRLPRSRGGTDHDSNISMVRPSDHKAYHRLFGNMNAQEAAAMLTDVWIDADFYLVAIPRKKKKRKKRRRRMFCVKCTAEVLSTMPVKEEKT